MTCPLGVHMIGYVMMCFGASDALSSFLFGRLQQFLCRTFILTLGKLYSHGLSETSQFPTCIIFIANKPSNETDLDVSLQYVHVYVFIFTKEHY